MARNVGSSSSNGGRRVSSRVAEPPPARPTRTRADRRMFWVRLLAALLVLAMLLPIVAAFISVL